MNAASAPPPALNRAVANLLRLASSDIKDAELLSAGRNPDNAHLLVHLAVRRTIEAILATEEGWPVSANSIDLEAIPDENPLKLPLMRFSKFVRPPKLPALLQDGNLPLAFDHEVFRQDARNLRKILQDAAEWFGVDLLGDRPAEKAGTARPAPKAEPVKPLQKPLKLASRAENATATRPAEPQGKLIKEKTDREPLVVPDTRKAKPATRSAPVEGRSSISPSPGRSNITSATFWGLMDRWRVPDIAALDLIRHGGGLSKKGTRPRFKLLDQEAEIIGTFLELDQAISNLGLDPGDWLKRPIKTSPFGGATPLALLSADRAKGSQEISRYLLRNGLKLSMSSN